LITGLTIIIIGALSFRPIVNPTEKNCSKIAGILQKYCYNEEVEDNPLLLPPIFTGGY
jgi:hypothetical protein